jgi:hypothetical protein
MPTRATRSMLVVRLCRRRRVRWSLLSKHLHIELGTVVLPPIRIPLLGPSRFFIPGVEWRREVEMSGTCAQTFGLLLLGLLWAAPSAAAPLSLHHQGRLIDATGVPLQGKHDVVVTLHTKETSGKVVWTEGLTLDFDNGYYAAELGGTEPLLDDHFGTDLYVSLEVGGTSVGDRQRVVSVPFAVYARTSGHATTADAASSVDGGLVDASEIQIDGVTVIDSTGLFVGDQDHEHDWADITSGVPGDLADGDADTLAGLLCDDLQIVVFDADDETWGCGDIGAPSPDDIINTVEGSPLDLDPSGTVGGNALADLTTEAAVISLLGTGLDASEGGVDLSGTITIDGVTALQDLITSVDLPTDHVLRTGDVLEGSLDFNNFQASNVNAVVVNDPGPGEGLSWGGTAAEWSIDVANAARDNVDGDLWLYGTAGNVRVARPIIAEGDLTVNGTGTSSFAGSVDAAALTVGSVAVLTGSVADDDYVNVSGDTLAGNIDMNNFNLNGVNQLIIHDPGPAEGLVWESSNDWSVDVAPASRTNGDGDLWLYGTGGNVRVARPLIITGDVSASGDLDMDGTGVSDFAGTVNAAALTVDGEAVLTPTDADDAYVNLSGDVMSGTLDMDNSNVEGVNQLIISDPGPGEGIVWAGTADNWSIDVAGSTRANGDGDLWLYGTSGSVRVARPIIASNTITTEGRNVLGMETHESEDFTKLSFHHCAKSDSYGGAGPVKSITFIADECEGGLPSGDRCFTGIRRAQQCGADEDWQGIAPQETGGPGMTWWNIDACANANLAVDYLCFN